MENHLDYSDFLEIYGGLLTSSYNIPNNLLKTLHRILSNEEFNAGKYFALIPDDEKTGKFNTSVICEEGLECSDEEAIFLIDHAVTYQASDARKLLENAELLNRIANIVGCPEETDTEVVLKNMWKFNQTYSIPSPESKKVMLPLWYILDEFGSSIHHGDEANVAMVPFFYQPSGISYTIMWLLKDLEYGDRLVRDFSQNEQDPLIRRCKLLPWISDDLTHVDSTPQVVTDQGFQDRFNLLNESFPDTVVDCSAHHNEGKVKVYFDHYQPGLTDDYTFEIVDTIDEADVVWTMNAIRDFKDWSTRYPNKMLNQFPCEQILINKDFFSAISIRGSTNQQTPAWMPLTFNLQTELPQFVSCFQQLEIAKSKDQTISNIWILKPWNLARGLQISVSDNLNEIIRLRETDSPKIVSKYVENPVLYHRSDIKCDVKFTMRTYVALKSVSPLQLFVSNLTRLHFANKQYAKTKFDEYERHFTVMNYFEDGKNLKEISLEEFIPNFESQYPGHKWKDVLDNTHKCVQELFLSATCHNPPYGVGHYQNSRALYAIDILLKWDQERIQPVLLECNFLPDCTHTCKTDRNFMNKVFKFLFTNASASECDMKDIMI